MEISPEMIRDLSSGIEKDSLNRILMNAVSRVDLDDLVINRDLIKSVDFVFSDELDVSSEATAQQKVGVCWLYAAMNLLRFYMRKKINLKNFEFSGPYLMFFDKLEKANYFLEKMIEFRDLRFNDREVCEFLKQPIPDGGDWYMFVNLIKKYGIIPASVMQHSAFSKDSTIVNKVLCTKLRFCASEIRSMHKNGASLEELWLKQSQYIGEIYKILVISFGTPPQTFNWSYRNDEKEFFREEGLTPLSFFQTYVDLNPDDYVSVWSSPLEDTPYKKMYTIAHTRKMVGGKKLLSLNLEFEQFKKYAVSRLKNHQPLLFSCDVTRDKLRKEGYLLKDLFNYDLIFQTPLFMEKANRLEMGETSMTHCMLIVGVDLDSNGNPLKWKVENSWGPEAGNKGYFVMSDEWFDDNVYQIVIPKQELQVEDQSLLNQEPVVLPLWHPLC